MLASVAETDPFPFVPAINTDGNFPSGEPRARVSTRICSSSNFRRGTPGFVTSSCPSAYKFSRAAAYDTRQFLQTYLGIPPGGKARALAHAPTLGIPPCGRHDLSPCTNFTNYDSGGKARALGHAAT